MARAKQTRGRCLYCGTELTKTALSRHLESCPKRLEVIATADGSGGAQETLLHLRVEDEYSKDFWLDLEMRGPATLKKLDDYLRAIWLECCGHLSEFTTGGFGGKKYGMQRKVEDVFREVGELTHLYDFGTTSYTRVKLLGSRVGKPTTKHPIALMARNKLPEVPCQECDQVAAYLCMECVIEDDMPGLLCEEHVKKHPHENYGEPMPLVNSPRLGMCGYDGPAEPPY